MPESLRKLIVFGAVGGIASLLHMLIAYVALDQIGLSIFAANFFGFVIAFVWSYVGHYYFTFQSTAGHRQSVMRFSVTAIAGYAVNNCVVLICVLAKGNESLWFIIAGIIVAAVAVFVASNFWAFAGDK